jgi:hypothetical protein
MRGKGCALQRGAYFRPGGGIGGLATNEKAMKARGCVRGRERDGPRSDWNIQQAETKKEADKSGDDLSSATWDVPRVLTQLKCSRWQRIGRCRIATKNARNSAVSLDSSHPVQRVF